MADAAFIRRKPDPDGNNRLSLDGTDVHYQMVPLSGTRESSAQISGGVVQCAVVKPEIATVLFGGSRDFARFDSAIEPLVNFQIVGLRVGKTEIVAEDTNGNRLDHLVVSVKSSRILTYNLIKLEDAFRTCPTFDGDLLDIMRLVEAYFLNQANTTLIRSSFFTMKFPKQSLGNPMKLREAPTPSLPFGKIALKVIEDDLQQQGRSSVNFSVFSTWALDSTTAKPGFESAGDTPDETGRKLCFVSKRPDTLGQAIVTAHEIGHSLGLSHFPLGAPALMAESNINFGTLVQSDIDHINPSGT